MAFRGILFIIFFVAVTIQAYLTHDELRSLLQERTAPIYARGWEHEYHRRASRRDLYRRGKRTGIKTDPASNAPGSNGKVCGFGLAYPDPAASPEVQKQTGKCIREMQGFAGTDPGALSSAGRGGPGAVFGTMVQNSLIEKACPASAKAAIKWKPGPCTPPSV